MTNEKVGVRKNYSYFFYYNKINNLQLKTRITKLLGIEYPIIQGGMIWASQWQLATAVSNAGGLGLLGSGSMSAEELRTQIRQCKIHTDKPFGVNVPIMYANSAQTMEVIMEEGVSVVFTSAGNPALWTEKLHEKGIKVVHVVSSSKFALKAQAAGVDAVVAEGFEAGGHNGREETTTLVLVPEVCRRVIATEEATVHSLFKEEVLKAKEGDTVLTLKELSPVRLLKNPFYEQVEALYQQREATPENLKQLLGKGRTKLGMYEGDLQEGELEIGQVSSLIQDIKTVKEIFEEVLEEFQQTNSLMNQLIN